MDRIGKHPNEPQHDVEHSPDTNEKNDGRNSRNDSELRHDPVEYLGVAEPSIFETDFVVDLTSSTPANSTGAVDPRNPSRLYLQDQERQRSSHPPSLTAQQRYNTSPMTATPHIPNTLAMDSSLNFSLRKSQDPFGNMPSSGLINPTATRREEQNHNVPKNNQQQMQMQMQLQAPGAVSSISFPWNARQQHPSTAMPKEVGNTTVLPMRTQQHHHQQQRHQL